MSGSSLNRAIELFDVRNDMLRRRKFLKINIGLISGLGLLCSPIVSGIRWVYAKTRKTILSKDTQRESLIGEDPADLDARNLAVTPLKDFGTMGITDHEVNLDEWRLEITGLVKQPMALTYAEVLTLPAIERKCLLICPGYFANQGRWKGISMQALLERVGVQSDVTHVTFSGPKGLYEKEEKYPIENVRTNKVFLAYGVNGKSLPKQHGFPLRVVADGYYGSDWVKYVFKMTLKSEARSHKLGG